jgi:hypothetical protein
MEDAMDWSLGSPTEDGGSISQAGYRLESSDDDMEQCDWSAMESHLPTSGSEVCVAFLFVLLCLQTVGVCVLVCTVLVDHGGHD